jgi:hypothetical protein
MNDRAKELADELREDGVFVDAADELDRLRAEVDALKKADPLAEMWWKLSKYQEQADRDGHGESWRAMCSEKTQSAAWYAAAAAAAAAWDASAAASDAESAASAAAWAAASAAAWPAAWDAERAAQRAELERMLEEVKP